MTWEIVALGDAEFLGAALNGVAAITATEGFADLIKIGLLLGLILVGMKGILSGTFELQNTFFSVIIFMMLIAPKTTVIISDPYSANDQVVDNVPLGIGAAGGIVSQLGSGLTNMFETAYSVVSPSIPPGSILQDGYVDPLRMLLALRSMEYPESVPQAASLAFNVRSHVQSCTSYGINTGELNPNEIRSSPDTFLALSFPSVVISQNWRNDDGTLTSRNCSDASAAIIQRMGEPTFRNSVFKNAFVFTQVDSNGSPEKGDEIKSKMDAHLLSLTSVGIDSWNFVNNQIVAGIMTMGANDFATASGDVAYVYASETAKIRRDLSHAAQGNQWEKIMRPIMTFLEVVVYCATPLLAFIIMIGPVTYKVAVGYLMTLFWIQMWLPVLAITRLYLYHSIFKAAAAMTQVAGSLEPNLETIQRINELLSTQLGIAGLMVSMTPVITLMLIAGGMFTANSLATNFNKTAAAAASSTESVLAPNPMSSNNGDVVAGHMTRQNLGSQGHSTQTTTGAGPWSLAMSDQAGSDLNSMVSHAETMAASKALSQSREGLMSSSANSGTASSNAWMNSLSADRKSAVAAGSDLVMKIARDAGIKMDERTATSIAGQAAVAAEANVDAMKAANLLSGGAVKGVLGKLGLDAIGAGISARLQGSGQSSEENSAALSNAISKNMAQGSAWSESLGASITNGSTDQASFARVSGFESQTAYKQAVSEGTTALRSIQDSAVVSNAKALRSSAQVGFNMDSRMTQSAARAWARNSDSAELRQLAGSDSQAGNAQLMGMFSGAISRGFASAANGDTAPLSRVLADAGIPARVPDMGFYKSNGDAGKPFEPEAAKFAEPGLRAGYSAATANASSIAPPGQVFDQGRQDATERVNRNNGALSAEGDRALDQGRIDAKESVPLTGASGLALRAVRATSGGAEALSDAVPGQHEKIPEVGAASFSARVGQDGGVSSNVTPHQPPPPQDAPSVDFMAVLTGKVMEPGGAGPQSATASAPTEAAPPQGQSAAEQQIDGAATAPGAGSNSAPTDAGAPARGVASVTSSSVPVADDADMPRAPFAGAVSSATPSSPSQFDSPAAATRGSSSPEDAVAPYRGTNLPAPDSTQAAENVTTGDASRIQSQIESARTDGLHVPADQMAPPSSGERTREDTGDFINQQAAAAAAPLVRDSGGGMMPPQVDLATSSEAIIAGNDMDRADAKLGAAQAVSTDAAQSAADRASEVGTGGTFQVRSPDESPLPVDAPPPTDPTKSYTRALGSLYSGRRDGGEASGPSQIETTPTETAQAAPVPVAVPPPESPTASAQAPDPVAVADDPQRKV